MNILYFHHAGFFGGSGKSLLELLLSLEKGSITPYIVCQRGRMADEFESAFGKVIRVKGLSQFDNTLYSFYRGRRWFVLLRELFLLPFTFGAVLQAKLKFKNIDLVEINEYTLLPVALIVRLFFRCGIIVHCRSVQRLPMDSSRAALIAFLYNAIDATIVAIDQKVASTIPNALACRVVHNIFSYKCSDEVTRQSPVFNATRPLVLGFVGGIGEMKGIFDLLEAVSICKENNLNVLLIITGKFEREKTSGLLSCAIKFIKGSSDVENDVNRVIDSFNIRNYIQFTGFKFNLADVYSNMDVLCFVSHFNATGRPVFEAGFFKKPSIVAIDRSWNDTIVDYKTGIIVQPKDAYSIYSAIKYYYSHPDTVCTMGENAFELANKNFTPEVNAKEMLSIYNELIK